MHECLTTILRVIFEALTLLNSVLHKGTKEKMNMILVHLTDWSNDTSNKRQEDRSANNTDDEVYNEGEA